MTEPRPSLSELFWGMLQVALSAFGGGLSAWSQRIVVEQRRWMSNEQFLTGLTVAAFSLGQTRSTWPCTSAPSSMVCRALW